MTKGALRHVVEQGPQALACRSGEHLLDRHARRDEAIAGQHQTPAPRVIGHRPAQTGDRIGDTEIARATVESFACAKNARREAHDMAGGRIGIDLEVFDRGEGRFLEIVLTGIETKTMMVLVTSFTSGGTDMFYGEASASVVLGVLPAFIVAFMLQRYLVKGLALGGTKG